MNYLKIYINLMKKANTRDVINSYFEKHHIFPVSIYGKNKKIVKLTAKEHYIAHALLEKIFISRYGINDVRTKKMVFAFFMMNNAHGVGQKRYTNSRLFEASKIRFSEQMTGENSPFYGKKKVFSEQHLANMRASRKYGEDNPLYGIPRSEEVKRKMRKPKVEGHSNAVSKARKGMVFSETHLQNLSKAHKGQIPWSKGKRWSDEQKQHLSEAQKNKNKEYITDEYKNKLSEASKKVWAERKLKRVKEQQHGN